MPIGPRQHHRIVRRDRINEFLRGPLPVAKHFMLPLTAPDQLARLRFGHRLFDLPGDDGRVRSVTQVDVVEVDGPEVDMSIVEPRHNQPALGVDHFRPALSHIPGDGLVRCDRQDRLALERDGLGAGVVRIDRDDPGIADHQIGGRHILRKARPCARERQQQTCSDPGHGRIEHNHRLLLSQ